MCHCSMLALQLDWQNLVKNLFIHKLRAAECCVWINANLWFVCTSNSSTNGIYYYSDFKIFWLSRCWISLWPIIFMSLLVFWVVTLCGLACYYWEDQHYLCRHENLKSQIIFMCSCSCRIKHFCNLELQCTHIFIK